MVKKQPQQTCTLLLNVPASCGSSGISVEKSLPVVRKKYFCQISSSLAALTFLAHKLQNNLQAFTFERRALELEELELAPNSDARLDTELDHALTDLEELSLLLLLLLLLSPTSVASLELMLERELLELEELELFCRTGASIFLSFIKTGFPSTISSSLRLICLTSFSAAFGPT